MSPSDEKGDKKATTQDRGAAAATAAPGAGAVAGLCVCAVFHQVPFQDSTDGTEHV
jgi:hypothetical protein